MTGDLSAQLAEEVRRYKLVRDTIASSSGSLLSRQVLVSAAEGWDAIQELADDQRTAILFVFKADAEQDRVLVKPRNLLAETVYEVRSVDYGEMGQASGADLMKTGIEVVQAEDSRAHVIMIAAQ